jgi:hypothetical protein
MNEVPTTSVALRLRAPLRALYDYAALYGSMLVFRLLCLCWSLLTLPLYALLPRRIAMAWRRYGMAPSLPIRYRVRLGRRFDPSPDVDAFVGELERYYHSEIPASTGR